MASMRAHVHANTLNIYSRLCQAMRAGHLSESIAQSVFFPERDAYCVALMSTCVRVAGEHIMYNVCGLR